MSRLLWIVLLALTSCGNPTQGVETFTRHCYTPRYASGFEICATPDGHSTLLRTLNPWQGAENQRSELIIRRNNEPLPAHFSGQVLEGDAQRIVCLSSSYIALFEAIGAIESVVGVSGIDFITNPYIAQHRDRIVDIGFDHNLNYEQLVGLDPDVVLLYGVSEASDIEVKLRELHIPYLYMGEYLEQSPLGKAEWMVFAAELLGKRAVGEACFAPIPTRYEALRSLAATAQHHPKVMLNTPYRDSWFMPSVENYAVRLLADAGGEYLYPENTSSRSVVIDLEEAFLRCSEADFWLNLGSLHSLEELRRQFPRFAEVRCVEQGHCYNNNRRSTQAGGNDFWESGVVQPDVVLRDLIHILHPELLPDTVELTYYKRLE